MDIRRNKQYRRSCQCSSTRFPFSSSFLFLSVVLPSSSYAQLGFRQNTATPPSPTTTAPTLFITSVSGTSSASTPSNSPNFNLDPDPDPDPDPDSEPISQQESHAFKYYFLIIVAFAIIFCICLLYLGRRKKRKQALLRSNSQRALARDVAGFRSRVPPRGSLWTFGGFGSGGGNNRVETVEGLDERGEAPPPYVANCKPPSLRNVDLSAPSTSAGREEAVELSRMSGNVDRGGERNKPPDYYATGSSEELGNVTRPTTAVTASDRFESERRLLSNTEGTLHG